LLQAQEENDRLRRALLEETLTVTINKVPLNKLKCGDKPSVFRVMILQEMTPSVI
jgi:hypothetical protein